jgi:hypothetical protein
MPLCCRAALLPVQPTAVCSRVMLMPPTHFCLGEPADACATRIVVACAPCAHERCANEGCAAPPAGGGALLRALCDGDSGGPLILQTLRKPDMQVVACSSRHSCCKPAVHDVHQKGAWLRS